VTRLWADQPELESWSEEIFFINKQPESMHDPPSPLHCVRGFSPGERKWPECDIDHFVPSSIQVETVESSSVTSWYVQDNF
jgi:hypothetical protein